MNGKTFFILILVALVVLGGGYYMTLPAPEGTELELVDAEGAIEATEDGGATDASPATFDLAAAAEPRILGDVNAPIRISEHSSLTCGHCGNFHKTSFKQVKAQLVDTGKAYIVFSDFPLNAPALHASMVARCIPDQARYFDFVQMLFEEQEAWAYERDYLNILKSKAGDYGLSASDFKACLESEELQESLVAGAKAAQSQFNVSSTPSFVVNNKTLISGGHSADEFIAKVNEVAGVSAEPAAAAEEPAPAPAVETEVEAPETKEPAPAPESTSDAEDRAPSRWGN